MAAKEQPAARDQTAARTATDQAAREQAAREQAAREQAAKEQAAARAREQAAKEQAPMEEVLQDQILSTLRTGQEVTLHLARTWVETFVSVTPNPFNPRTMSNLNNYQDFAERLWSTNRDFVVSLFKVASDSARRAPSQPIR